MRYLVAVLLAILLAACSTVKNKSLDLPPPYIPKHPDLVLPDPTFTKVKLADAKKVAAIIEQAVESAPQNHKDLVTFVGVVGEIYILGHRNEIMDCTDKRGWKAGPGMADPDCIWPRPYADDWVGCVALQFNGEEVFQKFHLATLKDNETVFIWIDRNYDDIIKDPDGKEFLIQLNGVPRLGAECEKIVRDQPPLGAIDVKGVKDV